MSTIKTPSEAPKMLSPSSESPDAPGRRKGYLGMTEGRRRFQRTFAPGPDLKRNYLSTDISSQTGMTGKTAKESGPGDEIDLDFEHPIDQPDNGEGLVEAINYFEAASEAREGIRESLEPDLEPSSSDIGRSVTPSPTLANMTQVCASIYPTRPEDIRKAQMRCEVLYKMSEKLRENTLESHKEVLRLLKESGLLANQRWNEIHSAKSHQLSRASEQKVNSFAEWALKKVELDIDSVILELGSGYANDALYFARHSNAHIIGVDASEEAVGAGRKNIDKGNSKVGERINLIVGNFFDVLDTSQGAGVAMVYSHSTLHYAPPLILREKTFPLIADVLRSNQEGAKWGKLCLAMKIADSASAKARTQMRLLPGDPYNPCVDKTDKLFRIYPKTKEDIFALLEPSFNIEYSRVVSIGNYDINGCVEKFCYVIASPKPERVKV